MPTKRQTSQPLVATLLGKWCEGKGLTLHLDEALGNAGFIEDKDGKRAFFVGTRFDINRFGSSELAKDKAYTLEFLARAGLPVPKSLLLSAPRYNEQISADRPDYLESLAQADDLQAFLADATFPLFVKPNDGSGGEDVLRLRSRETLEAALPTLFERHDKVLLQEEAKGREFRAVVLKGEILFALERSHPHITGDGTNSLTTLITDHHERLQDQIIAHLTMQELNLEMIPALGENIPLLPTTNLSKGGKAKLLNTTLSEAIKAGVLKAGQTLGLDYYAVDFLSPSLEGETPDWTILELNAAPGLAELHRQNNTLAALVEKTYQQVFDAFGETLR